jgi:hypothetical protein
MTERLRDFEEKEKVWKQNKELKDGSEKISQLQFVLDKMLNEKREDQ